MSERESGDETTEVTYRSPDLPLDELQGSSEPEPEGPGALFAFRRIIGFAIIPVIAIGGYFFSDGGNLQSDGSVRDESGAVIEGGDVGALALTQGDCLPRSFFTADNTAVREAPVVPCGDLHAGEVAAVHTVPEGADAPFPGNASLAATAETACVEGASAYLGTSADVPNVSLSWLFPTRETWEQIDDREITCIVVLPPGEDQRGSLRAAGI